MRILHTSDWHIGHRLYTRDRILEHQTYFDFLAQQIRSLKVDMLIVAGDIFDVAYPSNQALQQYYTALKQAVQAGCKHICIIGGNHDSVSTLNAPARVLDALGVRVIGGVEDNKDAHFVTYQENTGLQVLVGLVPFLRDKDIRKSVAGESYQERIEATRQGILDFYRDLIEYAQKNYTFDKLIMTGHLYANGAALTDSERDIQIGNLGGISVNDLPKTVDYWAFGHIHRPQKLGNNEKIRYSGAPIPLSFSERNDHKQMTLIDIEAGQKIKISPVDVPTTRKLVRMQGSFAEISHNLLQYQNIGELADWIEVIIKEPAFNPDFQEQFETILEKLAQKESAEVLKYKFEFENSTEHAAALFNTGTNLDELKEEEVFNKYLDENQIDDKEEIMLTFKHLLDLIKNKEE